MATIRFPPDFKEFLQLLNSHQIEYLLIGGYAVGYHGYPRSTGDIDVWIAMHDTLTKVSQIQAELWARKAQIAPERAKQPQQRVV